MLSVEIAPQPGHETFSSLTLSAVAVTILVSVLLPIVTGLLTKYEAPNIVKGLVALVVSSVNGLVVASMSADGTATISKQAIILAGISLATQTATYLNIYKPVDANRKLAPNVGLG